MFRLIRLTLLLIVACAAAIFAAHLIGGTRPNPLAILFTNPDGTPCQRPCLLGVRPGVTKYEDAVTLIRKHPFTARFQKYRIINTASCISPENDAIVLSICRGDSNNVILVSVFWLDAVDKLPVPYSITTGDIVSTLGVPAGIAHPPSSTVFYYPQGFLISTSLDPNSITTLHPNQPFTTRQNDPVGVITLLSSDGYWREYQNYHILSWQGFRIYSEIPTPMP